MPIPKPGSPVRGSSSGRPIMALLDLLGRRWCLRIIWELRNDALSFRQLREKCGGISPSVLNQRLREIREAGIVELRKEGGYILSQTGKELFNALAPLAEWSEKWRNRT